jgi:hypothetical protein
VFLFSYVTRALAGCHLWAHLSVGLELKCFPENGNDILLYEFLIVKTEIFGARESCAHFCACATIPAIPQSSIGVSRVNPGIEMADEVPVHKEKFTGNLRVFFQLSHCSQTCSIRTNLVRLCREGGLSPVEASSANTHCENKSRHDSGSCADTSAVYFSKNE